MDSTKQQPGAGEAFHAGTKPPYLQTYVPSSFVPEEVGAYLGDHPRVLANIKTAPDHFRVEELINENHLCTVGVKSDMGEDLFYAKVEGRLVAVTVVKRQMTTYDAAREVARLFGVDVRDVTYAGLKDRWAETSQLFVVGGGVELDRVIRNCCPEEQMRGRSFYLKDAHRFTHSLYRGGLVGNRFTIKVLLPGMSAAEVEAYVTPRLKRLTQRNYHFPNFFGRQRLGRRQNALEVGYTLITQGAEAAIKQFLCETAPGENDGATAKRKELAKEWAEAERQALESGKPVEQQWPSFDGMRMVLEPSYRGLNLALEHQIVEKALEVCDFNRVMSECKSIFSLWVGAYQGYWFNQALAKHLRGELKLIEGKFIPLYIKDPETEKWYRDNGMADAIIPDDQMDPVVRKMFLSKSEPRGNRRNGGKQWQGPRRKAFLPLLVLPESRKRNGNQRIISNFGDGVWNVEFMLPSGGYATTLLGMLFNIDQDDNVVLDERVCAP